MSSSHVGEGSAGQATRRVAPLVHPRLRARAELDARAGDLRGASVYGVDLTQPPLDVDALLVERTVFVGCRLTARDESVLRGKGAVIVPPIEGLPFEVTRGNLYSPDELLAGYDGTLTSTRDYAIYRHFDTLGRNCPNVFDALAQRLHDHAIDGALDELLAPRRSSVVAIMGGHGARRDDPIYESVARLAYLLGRAGFFVASGGGPGVMEAANLGAYFARWEDEARLTEAIAVLSKSPTYMDGTSFDDGYIGRAEEVRRANPSGAESLAIPTWFYGHEPTNLFGTHIAKYFSNGLREDTLLAIALGGVVFAPGSAGTTQEIFMDAAQNHYVTHGVTSPMVFFGRARYEIETQLFATVKSLAKGRAYERKLALFDHPAEALAFLDTHRTRADV